MTEEEKQARPVWLDPRAWVLLSLLSGTGIGGFGRGLMDDGTEKALADLRTEVALLRAEVKSASITAGVERSRLERDMAECKARVDKLDERLREVERQRRRP